LTNRYGTKIEHLRLADNPPPIDLSMEKLVLPDRIELSTSPLPMECSTTELRQRAPDSENRPKGPNKAGRSLPQGLIPRKRAAGPGRRQKPP
jgi:hypothetical protein